MKGYEKAETESKIVVKKDEIQSNDESIQLYEGDQKVYKKRFEN